MLNDSGEVAVDARRELRLPVSVRDEVNIEVCGVKVIDWEGDTGEDSVLSEFERWLK